MRSYLSGILAALTIAPMPWAFGSPNNIEQESAQSPGEQLKAIRGAQEEASREYHEGLEGAKSEEQTRETTDEFLAKVVENSDRALDLARHHPQDPAALDALVFVIRTAKSGPSDRSERAIGLLRRNHPRDERMGDVCQQLFFLFHLPAAERLIRTVLDESPDHAARGLACHALAHYLTYQARMVRRLRDKPADVEDYVKTRGKEPMEKLLREKDPKALEEEAARHLERAISEYGGVKYGNRTLAECARGELFELHRLGIGKAAPEIEGEDVDGKSFKLSDYRGKVIVLTFSGNWCGPCRAMYPRERELVERFKDESFVVLSVNTDEDRKTLRTSIACGEITWRCWWDGGVEGPITTRWSPEVFPTVYVLDSHGVIRYQNVQGEDLDQAVNVLMRESRAAAKPGRLTAQPSSRPDRAATRPTDPAAGTSSSSRGLREAGRP